MSLLDRMDFLIGVLPVRKSNTHTHTVANSSPYARKVNFAQVTEILDGVELAARTSLSAALRESMAGFERWLRKAAEAGNPQAVRELNRLSLRGAVQEAVRGLLYASWDAGHADVEGEIGTARTFGSPDQPRDEDGKWTDGGAYVSLDDQSWPALQPGEPSGSRALTDYAGIGSNYANAVARGRREQLGERQKQIGDDLLRRMDHAFSKMPPVKEQLTLYRGMNAPLAVQEPAALIGASFEDKGFTSTSRSKAVAKTFVGGGVLVEITTKPGAKALNVAKLARAGSSAALANARKEQEVLLDRGGKFTVTGYRSENKILVLEVVHAPR